MTVTITRACVVSDASYARGDKFIGQTVVCRGLIESGLAVEGAVEFAVEQPPPETADSPRARKRRTTTSSIVPGSPPTDDPPPTPKVEGDGDATAYPTPEKA